MKIWLGCTEENDIIAFSTYEKTVDYMKNEYMKEWCEIPDFELLTVNKEKTDYVFHIWDEAKSDYGYYYYIFSMELDSNHVEHL